MGELSRRAYLDQDARALTTFMRDLAVAASADPGLTIDAVRSWFSNGVVRDPAADTRLVFDDGRLAAAALLSPPPPDGNRVDSFGGVLPGWHGLGLGRELMSWSFSRARQLCTEIAPGAAWTLDADAYATEPAALHLFERFGMSPVRYWHEMAADLAALPAAPSTAAARPPGLRVVPFAAGLTAALYAAHNEAMADHFDFERADPGDWAEYDLNSAGFRPDLSRIALAGDEVAAYVIVADETPGRVRMEEIGTRRAWRRQGLASSLLAEVMTAAAADGCGKATLGVDSASPTGAVSIYRRAGFNVVSSWVSYRKPLA